MRPGGRVDWPGPFSLKHRQMPISSHAILPYIIEEVLKVKPKRVLDLGIGNGMIGAAVYNYATTLLDEMPFIHGVEAWKGYKGPMWDCYDLVEICDIRALNLNGSVYDAIIMADVIEHLDVQEGREALNRLKFKLSKGGVMVVSTPGIFVKQGAHKGNIFETHKCLWSPERFKSLGFVPVRPPQTSILGEKMLIYKFTNQ